MRPKRLISLLVAVCMMITMLPLSAVTAFAADTSPSTVYHEASDGTYKYYYTINADGKTATITNFRGPVDSKNTGPYNITIPTDLNYIPVTGIGNYAFYGRSALANVTIPQGITSIGDSAFLDCDTLISATIEEGVPTGTNMFNGCDNLATVKLPESLTTIATGSFASCPALNHVTIPDNVTTIGTSAFSLCNGLSDITLGRGLTTIGDFAFKNCDSLETIQLPSNLKKIGEEAFRECDILKSITLPDSVTDIGEAAFSTCPELESITIPENVTTIKSGTFDYCSKLTSITLPAGLTSFQDDLTGCLAGYLQATDIKTDENGQPILDKDGNRIYIYTPHGAIYFNNNRDTAEQLEGYDVLKDRNFLCLCHVTFDANGGKTDYDKVPVYETEKITDTKANELTAINAPTRAGYNFTGWYTADGKLADGKLADGKLADGKLENGKLFNVKDTAITDDITLYAGWEPAPKAPVCHPLTVTGGIVTVKNGDKDVTDTLTVTTDATTGKKTYSVPDGATVTVTLDKTLIPEGMVFDIWSTGKFSLPLGQDYKAESITFTMNTMSTMSSDADIAAQYRDATIEDDGPNVLGTAAIIGTAAVGTAVLGYQAYSLGAEFAGKLMALPYFPSNRSALAMMLWEDAGKPMPESELLYPDVGQEERDMDLQHAARWAMENELIPDLNDEGTAPEEMKFYPDNAVSKLDVLNAWQKAQELKNN